MGNILEHNGVVVIDEFQRLSISILEDLTAYHPSGKLILSGSSLGVVRKIFEPGSPLLGFFTPFKLSLINPIDILSSLKDHFKPIDSIELSCYLRDPWLIPLVSDIALRLVYTYACKYWHVVRALLGESFAEEERALTKVYDSILFLLGSFRWKLNEIANILYSRGLIKEPSSSHLSGFVKNLIEMDLIIPIKIYNSRRKIYRLKSPLMEAFYYLDFKYEVSERQVSLDEVRPTIEFLIRKHVEDFIADLLARYYNGRRGYSLSPKINIIITRRNRPILVGEVNGEVMV